MPLFFFFIQIAVLTEIALPLRGSGMAGRVPHHVLIMCLWGRTRVLPQSLTQPHLQM